MAGTLKLESERDINFSDSVTGVTPLMYAEAAGQTSLVRELIAGLANIHAETVEGSAALTFAAECASDEAGTACLELWIDAGADANKWNKCVGKNYDGALG